MTTEVDPRAPRAEERSIVPAWARAALGLISAAGALAVGSAVAALASATTPVDAIGSSFIDRTPAWLKELAITLFAENDKTALRVGIFLVISIVAVLLGLACRTTPIPIVCGITVAAAVGALSIAERPESALRGVLAVGVGAVCGVTSAALLWRAGSGWSRRTFVPSPSKVPLAWDRRSFLRAAVALTATTAVASGVATRSERSNARRIASQRPSSLPSVPLDRRAVSAPELLHGDVPFITPNDKFYRIDTALSFPRVDLDRWKLRIHGMVDTEVEFSYSDLLSLEQIERTITLCCVSNEVGGPYIGNAVWQGVLLADVLTSAGVSADAEQVFSTSLDGWTCGFPVEAALDGRDAMIAIGMNGEPLPIRHGFPARLVVPGLYGYVSATKWLSDIELNRWSDARGYWLPRGWSRLAPIKTQSRIDVPKRDARLEAGSVRIAGVAWAQNVGVSKVEVRIDDGPWQATTLSDDVSDDSWRMWRYDWAATSGRHTIQVRATDKNGVTQTDVVSPVAPDGATGWHTRRVVVT